MTSYKAVFVNLDQMDPNDPFLMCSLCVDRINDYGIIKIDTDKISSIREDFFCDIRIERRILIEFVSYMIKRKNVLFEKTRKNYLDNENICKKLVSDGKIKSFATDFNYVIIENVEVKIISMSNSNDFYIIPIF